MVIQEAKVLSIKEAKPCPWCGEQPEIEHWHGGPTTKRMISCETLECAVNPHVTGKTATEAKAIWNSRK